MIVYFLIGFACLLIGIFVGVLVMSRRLFEAKKNLQVVGELQVIDDPDDGLYFFMASDKPKGEIISHEYVSLAVVRINAPQK